VKQSKPINGNPNKLLILSKANDLLFFNPGTTAGCHILARPLR
jgi:hypothetical protein